MSGRVEGKVALVTGAARGQGRSHATRLAEEGADIIALDICAQIESVPYGMSTKEDLGRTVEDVEALDRRVVAALVDVRDYRSLKSAVDDGVARLGRLDIVSANAGISSFGSMETLEEQAWQDMMDVNLTGVWHTAKAAIPHLRVAGGGSITITSSVCGIAARLNIGHYNSSKHALVGLMKSLALELGPEWIRVNSLHPSGVDTDMIHNARCYAAFAPDLDEKDRTREVVGERFSSRNILPVPWVEAIDVSNALLWLASEEARYITGVALPIDAGNLIT